MLHADIKSKAETLTGRSVHPGTIPPKPNLLPAIAYTVNFDTSESTMESANGPIREIVTFQVMANNFDDLETVCLALKGGFESFGGTMGGSQVLKLTKLVGDETTTGIDDVSGKTAFLRTLKFSLTHR
jgi:hypothetical protein